jgi:RNA polymerase sigma-70 factor (ECF subfamily)
MDTSGSEVTDSELIGLARKGAARAFAQLMGRHLHRVQRLILRRVRDAEDARDIVQDTCVAVWRTLDSYDAQRPFEAWLTSIALNKSRDWARRRLVRLRLAAQMRDEASVHEEQWHTHSAEKLTIDQQSVAMVTRAFDALPSQYRQPLWLTTFGDLSQADAGRALNLTAKAIENRVRRARGRLAAIMLADSACG